MQKNIKKLLAYGLSVTCIITGMYTYQSVDASQTTENVGTVVPTKEIPTNEFVQKIELEDNVTIEKISDRNAQVTFKNPTLFARINYIREDYIIGRDKTSSYSMTKAGDTWTGDFTYIY